MACNPLFHFIIMGNAGRNKYFIIAGKLPGRFQRIATLAAAASTQNKDSFFQYLSLTSSYETTFTMYMPDRVNRG
jgi:hypothetical protein